MHEYYYIHSLYFSISYYIFDFVFYSFCCFCFGYSLAAESPDETCRPITAEISATNKTAFSAVQSSNVAGNKTDSAMVNRSEVYFDGGSSLCGNAPASNKSDGSEKFRMLYLKQRSHSDSGEFQVTAEPLLIPVDENSETSSPSYYSSNRYNWLDFHCDLKIFYLMLYEYDFDLLFLARFLFKFLYE